MDSMLWVDSLFRWMHVGTAIVLVGGTVFMRFVLMPSAASLSEEEHEKLRAPLIGRWKLFVHIGILLLLVSGLYNYIMVMIPKHRGDGLYHGLLGTKMILAFVIFFLASVLVGRASAFEKMRQDRKKWLFVIIILATIIVLISGFVKVRPWPPAEEQLVSQSSEVSP